MPRKRDGQRKGARVAANPTPVSLDDAFALYRDQRLTLKEAGKLIGVSATVLWRRFNNAGYKLSRGPRPKLIPADELRRLYLEEKRSIEELGLYFGVSRETIKRRVIEIGCAIRRPASLAGKCELAGCKREGKNGHLASEWHERSVKGSDGKRKVLIRMVVCRMRHPGRQLHAWFVGPHGERCSPGLDAHGNLKRGCHIFTDAITGEVIETETEYTRTQRARYGSPTARAAHQQVACDKVGHGLKRYFARLSKRQRQDKARHLRTPAVRRAQGQTLKQTLDRRRVAEIKLARAEQDAIEARRVADEAHRRVIELREESQRLQPRPVLYRSEVLAIKPICEALFSSPDWEDGDFPPELKACARRILMRRVLARKRAMALAIHYVATKRNMSDETIRDACKS
jgi:hypothetical protein